MDWFIERITGFFTTDTNNIDFVKLIIAQIVIIMGTVFSVYMGIKNDIRIKKNTFINIVTSNRITWMQENVDLRTTSYQLKEIYKFKQLTEEARIKKVAKGDKK
jgi:hypothetical protein